MREAHGLKFYGSAPERHEISCVFHFSSPEKYFFRKNACAFYLFLVVIARNNFLFSRRKTIVLFSADKKACAIRHKGSYEIKSHRNPKDRRRPITRRFTRCSLKNVSHLLRFTANLLDVVASVINNFLNFFIVQNSPVF